MSTSTDTPGTPRVLNRANPPRPTSLAEVRSLAAIPVSSTTGPNLAGLLGVSKGVAYRLCAQGEVPSLKLGYRVVVPVPRLLTMLGETR